ncbi:esterase/lipase family protein [Rhodococcus koreensis]|uniref:esterase/lipase family protein n=1 Tax=Rhodococcus koreensis TaxID=99653 RepID=UPI00366A6AB5
MTIPLLRTADEIAKSLRLPLYDEACAFRQRRHAYNVLQSTAPTLDAGGLPVVLVGGLLSTPWLFEPMRQWFDLAHCGPTIAPVGLGIDCGERTTAHLLQFLEKVARENDRPAMIVAHSRGGQFARAAAVRRPDLVRALITMGSPLNRLIGGLHPILKAEAAAIGMAGTLGAPRLMRYACLNGQCCRELRKDLTRPFPQSVPFLSIFSYSDTVVDWRSSLDPFARHRHIPTTHLGLLYSFDAVADELGRILYADRVAARTTPVRRSRNTRRVTTPSLRHRIQQAQNESPTEPKGRLPLDPNPWRK